MKTQILDKEIGFEDHSVAVYCRFQQNMHVIALGKFQVSPPRPAVHFVPLDPQFVKRIVVQQDRDASEVARGKQRLASFEKLAGARWRDV